jgi:exonuclease V gamma subunit
MSRFLRTLAKVGLVELDEHEAPTHPNSEPLVDEAAVARILAEDDDKPAARKAVAFAAADAGAPIEGRTLEEIYAKAELPPSPFPAEKLLKLLDGLRVMDPATRKAAVLAMDSADDSWTIEDSLLDAERKTRVLRQGCEHADALAAQAEERAKQESLALDEYSQKAADTIRKQIADLEQLMQDELRKAAEQRAQIQADMRSAREAALRERARYELEITRLSEIATMFTKPSQDPNAVR